MGKEKRMLGSQKPIAFLATMESERAKSFYRDVLGLTLIEDSPFALVFDSGGVMLRIQKVTDLAPSPYTALGWDVEDIGGVIRALIQRGVRFERFARLEQDGFGIWTSPSGAKVAWFKDPDGNALSLTQFPA
jgi:catechol 2,3-dioxygenase-like lactoylglutathione lyase family enzyme